MDESEKNMKKKKPLEKYDNKRNGFAGSFGSGANIDIRYLQTAFSPGTLDSIKLIEDIHGSEKWNVRDLFQRNVNQKRVSAIKKFLLDSKSVKFFNPITLVLLPYDQHTQEVLASVKHIKPITTEKSELTVIEYENEGFFRLDAYQEDPSMSELHWNQEKTLLVAIDGQHRLSAIKQIMESQSDMGRMSNEWSIPAVILVMSKTEAKKQAQTILEAVRRTFININQEAAQINRSRLIILDDESVTRICCQELVNAAHKNDQQTDKDSINKSRTPLMFFDWRGEVDGNKERPVPGSILPLVELETLLQNFIIGEDGSEEQRDILQIKEIMSPRIENFEKGKRLTSEESNAIRSKFNEVLLSALQYLFENLDPYREYIEKVRELQFPNEISDLSDAAFKQICFGTPPTTNQTRQEDIRNKVKEMVENFANAKAETFETLLTRDIGLRGIFSAFGHLKGLIDAERGETVNWLEYSEWFVSEMNRVIKDGWFQETNSERDIPKLSFREHVVFKPSGDIDNYKPKDVDDAFGSLLALEVAAKKTDEFRGDIWEKVEPRLRRIIAKGIRTEVKAKLKTEPLSHREFNERVKQDTNQLTESRIDEFKSVYLPPA